MITLNFNHCSPGRLANALISAVFRSLMLSSAIAVGVISFFNSADASSLSEAETRGEYLAAVGNCVSCHTADENGSPFAGGLGFVTQFGTLYSTNITPDPETGLGLWSLEDFSAAMREGKRADGKHLYPVFPYTAFTIVSDADIADLYAYLKTVTPVKYTPPKNDLNFPFNLRWALGLWKSLYFKATRFEEDPDQSAEWNRGAYLVEGLGHCGMCHTPRNFLGAEDADMAMTGGVYMERVEGKLSAWSAPNMTSSESGLAAWSVEEITDYLKLGFSHRSGVFGPMNQVVLNSTRHMTTEDVRAMAVYLKSLPPNAQDSGKPAADAVVQAGLVQYDLHCGTCHWPTGEGSATTGPTLVGSPVVLDADPSTLINITLYGAQTPKTAPSIEWQERAWRHKPMERYDYKLSDLQIAALLSFVRSAWGNKAGAVTPEQVAAQR